MNQYQIYEAIGRGKHSTVYKGRKKKTVEYYAIKSVEKSQKSRVLQEVRILHSLDHSNVLNFFAWYETSAHLWLVLEYCVGGDLLTLLRQDSRLPEESIHDFARDLVQALQFLHSKGVIYCDLKPSNILLDENGRLKLCDFGLARRLSEISKNSVQKLPQAKRGTPCYMAPELFEEGGVHSFASDLWALGCVIYECFAGRPPFISSSFTQLVKSILSDPVPPLKGNPSKELVDLVSLLLMKDPRQRMQWPELREHAFWRTKFKSLLLPSQPAYLTSIQLLEKKSNLGKHHHAASKESLCNVNPNLKKDSDSFGLDRSDIKKADSLTGQKAGPAFIGTAEIVPDPVRDNERQVLGGPGLSPSKESPHQANNAVNLLRLSRIVKNNLQKETEGENYRQTGLTGQLNDSDVILENNDLELDFGERIDDNDGDEILGPATSEICSKAEEHVSEPHKRSWQEDAQFASSKEKDVSAKIGIDKRSVEVGEIETSKVEGIMLIDVGATPPGVGVRRKAQHSAWNTESKNANPNPVQNGECGVISHLQVLWHPSDMAVRPIMVHRKVEKSAESMYEARMLPVESLSSLEFVKLAQEQFDIFVDKIVANVNGNTATNEKLNTLKYVESLCNNVDAANLLINGPLMTVIVKMLRTSKPPALRFQLIYVMGLLIRHATLIEDELASSGIIAVLVEGLRDKQDKVRRCSMATLGELLFYIATQNESSVRSAANDESPVKDGRSSSVWQVPNTLTSLVSSILRKGEDDATQHYALKTIENIASQRGDLAARFTNNEVIGNLCYIFKASVKQENLRVTAGSCLVRLIRHSRLNTILVLERIPIKDLVAVLMKGSSQEQQVSINLLNMAMAEGSSINNINKYFMALIEERTLAPCLLNLLEQGSAILRGKAVVCAALLCKVNRRWLPLIGNAKFLSAVERLVKEKDQYIQQCVDFFVEELVALVPGVLDSISNDTQQLSSAKRTSSVSSHGRNLTKSSLSHFPVVLNLFSSSIFRYIIMSEEILSKLAGLMKKLDSASFQHQDEFQSTLLRLMEIFGQQPSFLLQFRKIFLSEILPDLAVRYRKNSDGDMRFLCVKVFFDILLVFLDELADSSSVKGPDNNQVSNLDALRCITKMHFLPLYSALIEDEDPIPVYAQKLLVMLLDIKCIMITDILQLKLISQFFEFLREDISSINLYSVRLCLFLASAAEVETRTLSELLLVKRVSALIEFVYAKEMTDFLHPVLLLCKAFLIRCTGKNNCNESNVCDESSQCETIQDIAEFRTHAALLVDLCSSQESYIAEAAAECLFLLMGVAPRETTCIIYSSCMSSFNHALESCADSHKPVLQRWLLSVLCIACREQRLSSAGTQCSLIPAATIKDIMAAEAAVDRLKTSKSQGVAAAAQDASLELQVLSQQAGILMADG